MGLKLVYKLSAVVAIAFQSKLGLKGKAIYIEPDIKKS
jgi:hypothetical protein